MGAMLYDDRLLQSIGHFFKDLGNFFMVSSYAARARILKKERAYSWVSQNRTYSHIQVQTPQGDLRVGDEIPIRYRESRRRPGGKQGEIQAWRR